MISVITVCYNSEKTIRETFDSVLAQSVSDFEYIVVDGLSTDHTMEIVHEYEQAFRNKGVRFLYRSEKDHGIFDAMNKGIAMASGDIIGIINSDDILHDPRAFEKIINRFKEDNCDAVYSDLMMMDSETMSRPNRVFIAGKKSYKLGWYPPHPTLYVKRELYEKYGNYNTDYKVAADYDFMLRIMKHNVAMSYIREVLVYMRAGGASTHSLRAYKKSFDEAIDILRNNGIPFPYFVNSLRTLLIFKQRALGILAGLS